MSKKEVHTPDSAGDIAVDVQRALIGKNPSRDDIEIPVASNYADVIKQESFMNDVLDVTFSQPRDHNDFVTVRVGHNGTHYEYPRNNSCCKVPRFVVEILARSKTQHVATKLHRNEDGSDVYVPVVQEAHTYPFSVTRDPRQNAGFAWLQGILNERLN